MIMQAFRKLSLRRKLRLITMAVGGVALLLACLAFLSYEQVSDRSALAEELLTTAGILGENSSAALSFNDPSSAAQTLGSLHGDADVVGAAVYDRDGKVFAKYDRADDAAYTAPAVQADGYVFRDDVVDVFRSIVLEGERIGSVHIRADLSEIDDRLWRFVGVIAGVVAGAAIAAFLLSGTLLAPVTGPISRLSEVVNNVRTTRNYKLRVDKEADDELGRLIDGFNDMLGEIEMRDQALQLAQAGLEQRVAERTSELQEEVAGRAKSEASLRESNARFELVTRMTTNIIWDWDLQTKLVWWNENLQSVLGYPAEVEPTAKFWMDRLHPEDTDRVVKGLHEVIDGTSNMWNAEYRFLRGDGSYAVVFDRGFVLRDAGGKPVRMIGAMEDITQRRRAEQELDRTHRELLDASRRGGMAEVATNVLHNVGNVLNSVNVSANLVIENFRKSRLAGLGKAVAMLEQNREGLAQFLTADPRGKQLPGYLVQLSAHLASEHQAMAKELQLLLGNIDHIKDIVSMQQSYAKMSGVKELVKVADLVEDSLRMNDAALRRHGVTVIREFADVPAINVEKHKVLQILVNLIRNAKYACDEAGRSDGRLTLAITRDGNRVRIVVNDNGVGIPAENLTRIFSHGFTTRKDGHGFGLHSGALAAKEMGGSLRATSEGPGKGATFTLELPIDGNEAPAQLAA